MAIVEYPKGAAFPGVIGRTTDESSEAWPAPVRAKKGTPNVLWVVLDDTGFGNLGCYGSPIETPNFDALAADGLRFNNMHTTALCSPSRACVVTGRNHHSNGMACITEFATGYPGYNGIMPFENGMLSEMLLEHGYNTYMVGKWHLTPSNQETAAGPYDRWPLARGFERFYGFLGGDTSQWYPDLVYDNHQVEPPATPEEGYHLTPTSSTSRSSSSPTRGRSTPTSPSTCTSASAPRTRRTTCPRSGRTSTPASSTTAGRPTARRPSRARRSWGSSRPTRSSPATTPTCPTGTRCPRRRASSTAA